MGTSRIHILFFTTFLGRGGAEKLLLRVINNLDREKFQLSLALCKKGGSYATDLAEDISVYHLVNWQGAPISLAVFLAGWGLRSLINRIQPDIVCGFLDNVNVVTILATRGMAKKPKTILSVHAPLSFKYNPQLQRRLINKLIFALIPHTYPEADAIIAVSDGVAKDIEILIPSSKNLLRVIYNSCVDEQVIKGAQEIPPETIPPESKLIVACGRLSPEKGFGDLISVLARVRNVVNTHLWILGEGELRGVLEKQIESLGLENYVRLLGFQANPYQYMAKADLFVLSSLYEGFGNVIVEAMACGTPVVSVDCPYGPREIIDSGVNGLLVKPGDKEALAQGIIEVLTNSQLKKQFRERGKIRAQDFETKKIAKMYGELFFSQI